MKKTKVKNIVKIFVITIILTLININISKAVTSKKQELTDSIETKENVFQSSKNNKELENYTIDISNEEELEDTIKGLMLTINSEGMSKDLLSQAINIYTQITEKYSNNEIATIIEDNRDELIDNGISSENLDNSVKVLNSINTQQLKKVLETVDIDEVSNKIENGENIVTIAKDITKSLSPKEKINLIFDILLSANAIKTVLIVIVVLFVYRTLLRCVIYKKAKKQAWAPFVPIYRNIVMLKICNMSPWWLLLLLLPVVGWLFLWVIYVASRFMLAEGFNKGVGFAFGLWLLPIIFESIIVFSKKTKYIGFEEEDEEVLE